MSDLAASTSKTPRWILIIVFCLFAGLIPETLVTSSTSPLKMVLNPLSLPFIALFYGTADLVIREVIVRRPPGLATLVLLGAAFGFINEGVAAGTWYTVRPNGYLVLGGIDWTWAVALTVFHTIVSVIAPIAFFEILFPSLRGRSLLGRRGIVICLVLFAACTALLLKPTTPQIAQFLPDRLAVWAVAVTMSVVALALPPPRRVGPSARPMPGLWRLRLAGFAAMFAYFFLIYALPALMARLMPGALVLAQAIDIAAMLAFAAFVIRAGWSWSQRAGWSARENLALLTGGVAFTTFVLTITQANVGEPFAVLPFFGAAIALTVRLGRGRPALSGAPGRDQLVDSAG